MKEPIGVFDSGIGGTSILKELVKELPNEHMIYIADSANAPYGERSKKEILELCQKKVEFLLSKKCKLIVVACNTATTNAISELRSQYSIPFIGIEPAIKPAALKTKTKAIGVLATQGTLSSALFAKTSDIYADTIEIIEVVGKGLVEYIEADDLSNPKLKALLIDYLKPMLNKSIDYLVLGCSHYPYLEPLLHELLPKNIKVIDSGEAVARQTHHILSVNNIKNTSISGGKLTFFTNGDYFVINKILAKVFDNQHYTIFKDFK